LYALALKKWSIALGTTIQTTATLLRMSRRVDFTGVLHCGEVMSMLLTH